MSIGVCSLFMRSVAVRTDSPQKCLGKCDIQASYCDDIFVLTFYHPILLWCVWIRGLMYYIIRSEERFTMRIDKLSPIVRTDDLNGFLELTSHHYEEVI